MVLTFNVKKYIERANEFYIGNGSPVVRGEAFQREGWKMEPLYRTNKKEHEKDVKASLVDYAKAKYQGCCNGSNSTGGSITPPYFVFIFLRYK
ncbi:hypothetical protein PN36_31250 [Candidatus Thiomargarita nelsonii]|uniref:Uncharacterized protein n=1 Tax=Candidatus Thiomargarita nelsonii TaxID=1003181 RepID=A0A0A6P4Z7_9GAMM|nr:hypothetical protein PN36_24275 [Candidatus Thiomargarita nelsonii]KHD10101.1 hypothetical protein PN36_31250 [Candidatus Thiomargarita nelsonii]